MNNIFFQKVFDELRTILPDKWEKMVYYVFYAEGSFSMKYYIDCGDGKFIDCFSQRDIDRKNILKVFMDLDKIISAERNKLDDKDKWYVFTMDVDSSGKMKSDFGYTDVSENITAFEKEWKNKYLK